MMIKIMKTYNDQNIYKSNEYYISCAQTKKKLNKNSQKHLNKLLRSKDMIERQQENKIIFRQLYSYIIYTESDIYIEKEQKR